MTVPSEAELRLDGSGGGSDGVDGSVAHHGHGSGAVAYARGDRSSPDMTSSVSCRPFYIVPWRRMPSAARRALDATDGT